MLRYGLTKRQVQILGGVDHLDAMSEDARRVLVNDLKAMKKRSVRW
jgi:hypothetical protein